MRLSLKSGKCIRAKNEGTQLPQRKKAVSGEGRFPRPGQMCLRENSAVCSASHLQQAGAKIIARKPERLCLVYRPPKTFHPGEEGGDTLKGLEGGSSQKAFQFKKDLEANDVEFAGAEIPFESQRSEGDKWKFILIKWEDN